MNASLTVIAHIRAKAGQESRVRQILQGLLAPTRARRWAALTTICTNRKAIPLSSCFMKTGKAKAIWKRMRDPRTFNPFEGWRTRLLLSPYKSQSGRF